MRVDFLKDFDVRMKRVGAYALICKNSMFRTTWKNYGFEEIHEYINLIFAVMLYIMEESLKDAYCTMDNIAGFIDDINMKYFKKPITFEQCKELGEFIVNTVLCDEGKAMYFKGYDFEENEYREINISFVANRIVYIDDAVRRTVYYLTDEGYSLILSTLEIENNMKLTIQEMIFRLHLQRASYDKAVDDIKNIFNELRIQIQRMKDAIRRIRQNALNYSVEEYRKLLEENMSSLDDTRVKFHEYRKLVNEKINELKQQDINIQKLNDKEKKNLEFLSIIEGYLERVIEEQQKILNTHFDFKSIYSKELEEMTAMAIIKRFNITTDIYEKVIEDSSKLESIDYIFRSLYRAPINKFYNINKSLQYQKSIKSKEIEEDEEISFDEAEWIMEKEEEQKRRLEKYKNSVKVILELTYRNKQISLKEISDLIKENKDLRERLIPSVEIFREVIIELLKSREIDINELKNEKESVIIEKAQLKFQLSETILNLIEESIEFNDIKKIFISKGFNDEKINFYGLPTENGMVKKVVCSDVLFEIEK